MTTHSDSRRSRSSSWILFVASFWPVTVLVMLAASNPTSESAGIWLASAGLATIWGIIQAVIHVTRNSKLTDRSKIVWTALIVGLNMVVLPIYWCVQVAPDLRHTT
jgi:hypothetical protein